MNLHLKLIGGFYIRYCFLFLILSLTDSLFVSPVFAGPITFNTAISPARGEGILRIQSQYMRSTDDPGPRDRELTVWAFPLVGVYGVTEKVTVFGIVPLLDKSLDVDTPTGRINRSDSGIGDMTFLTRYRLWKQDRPGQTIRIAPFAGIEVPTGDDDEKDSLGPLPQTLQLGSGSWDPSLGIVITRQTLQWQIDSSASYKFNTEANNFEFGDIARLHISYQYRLWPRNLGAGVPGFIYGVLESNLIWRDRNKVDGENDKDSGGTTWYLTPGIQYVTKRIVLEGAIQLPAIQDLNGDALENDFIATLSFRGNF